jgi:hypothetical protein
MNYALLRELGINRLQELSGNTWTDFNIHDPGVTILEALAYAITDLGYRSSYKMQDILALDPSSTQDIRNFFSAYDVLTNRALTPTDYRKLLINVQVTDPDTGIKAGVKNAWLLKAENSEIPFYVHSKTNELSYDPDPAIAQQEPVKLKGLYNIMLEFDENLRFGDMNENIITGVLKIADDSCTDTRLLYKNIVFEMTMPRWDTPGVDWNDQMSIRSFIKKNIIVDFSGFPDNYLFYYTIHPVTGIIDFAADPNIIANLSYSGVDADRDGQVQLGEYFTRSSMLCFATQINDFLFNATTGLVAEYQRKVKLIFQLVDEVQETLMANRNLCEDFLQLNAVKVEEISMCGEILVENDAHIEVVMANIYHEVGKFLSPTVFFHTLDEMIARGKTTDEIFLGPKLSHGFIDDEELDEAGFRESIHVSDLYKIIMQVPGVVAIKNLQIANFPEVTDEDVKSKSVKWCLELAFAKNFIPRLSVERSNITVFKDVLPFEPDEAKILSLLADLKAQDPPQRLENPVLDIPIPQGEFKELDSYTSVQDEFPLVYGIGQAGLPDSATALRKSQAKQLKGFLMFLDQLLGDYLAQLSHVKELFSLNEELDTNGNPVIGRTYYTQTLFNIVPDAAPLYVNSQIVHEKNLDEMAESNELFESRRNRFLDHLLARFGETFTDYAMLTYTLDGPKAADELITDKLRFLNDFPRASSDRGTAFNYSANCKLWNVENISGLEERAALLAGIDPFDPSDLVFPLYTKILDTLGGAPFTFKVYSDVLLTNEIFHSSGSYNTLDDVFLTVEKLIIAGLFPENYKVFDTAAPNTPIEIDLTNPPTSTSLFCRIYCDEDEDPLAESTGTPSDFTTLVNTKISLALQVFGYDYERLPSTNRKDLDCALEDNLALSTTFISADDTCPDRAQMTFTLSNDTDPVFNPVRDQLLVYNLIVAKTEDETLTEFQNRVSNSSHDLFLEFLLDAVDRSNYRLEVSGGNYVFSVIDNCKETIASSVETNFNLHIKDFIDNDTTGLLKIYDQNGNEIIPAPATFFDIQTATVSNDQITITLSSGFGSASLPINYSGGKISKDFLTSNVSVDAGRKRLIVNEDMRGRVLEGDIIEAVIASITYKLTVTKVRIIDYNGPFTTEITVKESFNATASNTNTISSTFFLPIVAVTPPPPNTPPTVLILKGGVDEIAINEFIDYIKTRFLGHEGMHLVEHILLRPTTKKKIFEAANDASMASGLSPQGDLYFVKKVAIFAVDKVNRIFTATGDVTTEIQPLQSILVSGSNLGSNDRSFTVQSISLNGSNTDLKVVETISDDTTPRGDVSFTKKVPVGSVTNVLNQPPVIKITNQNLSGELNPNTDVFIIKDSQDSRNDTRYIASNVSQSGNDTDITVGQVEVEHKDSFLMINQISNCDDCRYTDPYSFVVSVILPFWRGRFSNMTFRNFFERNLRMEAPAHVALNICWINCEQMKEFEQRYKIWLYLRAKRPKDIIALSDAQRDLLETLQKLRTVYPKGTLHDCEIDPLLKNSIILNRSALGTI